MATVDNLDIQISASVTKANASLNTLINRLDRVSASLMNVNSRGLATMGSGVNKLSNAMNNFSNNTKTADFSRLARNLASISNVNTAGLSRLASGISSVSASLSRLPNMSNSAQQLGTLASGIAKLGYKSADKAIQNIPQLAVAMRQLMTELSKAPRVSQNLINMTNALAALARTGASSGRAANSMSKMLNLYSASANKATKSTLSLASAIGKLYASYWVIFRAFRWIKQAIDISSDLTEVQNVVDVTFGDMAYKVEDFAQTSIEKFGMSELTLKKVASQFQAMGSAMNISGSTISNANRYLSEQTQGYIELGDSMADVSLNLTKLTADMASFYNVEQEAVAEDLQSIFTGQTKPLRQYGVDLTEVNLKQWAMTQGLNSNIEAMTQAEKAMLRYQYVLAHTGAAQGDFARTSDTWANQVRILKQNFQQLASILGGVFINSLKPIVKWLNSVISGVIAFAETISNALGKIFGWKFESSGGGVASDLEVGAGAAEDIAGGMGDAADNAKRLKSNLLGIDELNVLQPDTDSGSSGGGTGGAGAGGTGAGGGQWVKQESILEEFESEIDTLYKLGEYVRDALIGAMESIDWEAVYEKARGFGKGLADYLNGMLAYDGEGRTLFGSVGKTLANTLNTVVYAALSFQETFDFYQFGVNIADGINKFFENFDFKSLAKSLNEWKNGLGETIAGFLNTLDWETIGQGIKDFFSEIDIETVALIIGYLTIKKLGKVFFAKLAIDAIAKTFATQLGGSLATSTTMAPVAGGIFGGIPSAWTSLGGLGGILTADLATILSTGTLTQIGLTLGTGLVAAILSAVSGWNIGQFIDEKLFGDIGMSFSEQMSYIWETVETGEWKNALKLWHEDLVGIGDEMDETVKEAMNYALADNLLDVGLVNVGVTKDMETLGKNAAIAFEKGASATNTFFAEILNSLNQTVDENSPVTSEKARQMGERASSLFGIGIFGMKDTVPNAVNAVKSILTGKSTELSKTGRNTGEKTASSFEKGLSEINPKLVKVLKDLGVTIKNEEKPLNENAKGLGEATANGYDEGMEQKKPETLRRISQYASDIVSSMKNSDLRFSGNSRRMLEFGRDTVLGYNSGITNNQPKTTQVVRTFASNIKNTFSSYIPQITQTGTQTIQGFLNGFNSKAGEAYVSATNVGNGMQRGLSALIPSLSQTGAQLMQSFIKGFEGQMGALNMTLMAAEKAIESSLNSSSKKTLGASKYTSTGSYTAPYSNVQYQAFATGGFPEDGWFRASKGEYFGRFDDGTSYIATNNQIVDGVAAGVARGAYQAFSQAYAENTREASLLEELIVAVKQGSTIQIDGRKLVTEINQRSTRNGYAF